MAPSGLPNTISGEGIEILKSLDANKYATKKTIAQGLLDVALLTANASQLKYILQVGEKHEFYVLMLTLISISIVLQVVVGLLCLTLHLLRDCRLHLIHYHYSANFLNHVTTLFALVITILNLIISCFDPTVARYALIIAILFVIIGGLNINKHRDHAAAILLNDAILIFIFLISIINIIISGFGIEYSNQPLTLINQYPEAPPKVTAALLSIVVGILQTYQDDRLRNLSWILNHISLGFVTGALFCDVIKMNFGLDPAVALNVVQAVLCVLLGSTLNLNNEDDHPNAERANDIILCLNIVLMADNILISSFEMKESNVTY